jgi:regulator of protease activity HflC (stomatin/prohibitin superfamily)
MAETPPPPQQTGEPTTGARMQDDAATRSLADALQVSFALLKVAMVVLLVIYLGSGVFRVPEQSRAVRLVFGQIVKNDEGANRIYDAGLYVGLPYPIGEVIQVPVTSQTTRLDRPFWFEVREQDLGKDIAELAEQYANRALNPEQDGSLLTGDANIVMGRFRVTWKVNDPALFIENVGLAGAEEDLNPLSRAERLVRNTSERSIVHAVSEVTADAFISGGGSTNTEKAARLTQTLLDELRSGIQVERIEAVRHIPPPSAYAAFQAVSNAESQRANQINQARQEAARTLGETAGKATEALVALIERYELAVEAGRADESAALLEQINTALAERSVPVEEGALPLGGAVAERINQAEAYRDRAREQVKAEAQAFSDLLAAYRANPRILVNRLWQNTRERVLTAEGVETIYAPTSDLRLDIGGDPKIERLRQERSLEAAQEAARQDAQP